MRSKHYYRSVLYRLMKASALQRGPYYIWDERDGMVQCFEFDGISGEWKMVEAYAYS